MNRQTPPNLHPQHQKHHKQHRPHILNPSLKDQLDHLAQILALPQSQQQRHQMERYVVL